MREAGIVICRGSTLPLGQQFAIPHGTACQLNMPECSITLCSGHCLPSTLLRHFH
jgi:hypothetical protein